MITTDSDAKSLIEIVNRKAPEYLDLLTAKTDEEFLIAFDAILDKAVEGLESNSKNFGKLREEGLTGVLALALTIPGLTVTQETNSNGHVDLTISADHSSPVRKVLGEAKIYRSPSKYLEGLEQLLGRYVRGRELRHLLIVYFLNRDIDGLIRNLREQMDDEHPCLQQGSTRDHTREWSFLSTHAHSSGKELDVCHIGCNLFVEEKSPSEVAAS